MRNRKYIIYLFAAVTLLLVGCSESLEDTYSDYAGDGKIRYVAKCSDVHVTPRWERLVLDWTNGTDATIDKIKVVWSCEDRKDSVLLPKGSVSYELKDLTDGTYRFDVCATDKDGNESLKETTYGRPYTRNHEVMLAFTRGVLKSYFLKNSMVFFADQWNANIEEIKLQYKNTQGETKYYTFKDETYSQLITIPDVSMNPADTIYVLRKGKVEDCPDVIEFDPFAISRKKSFSAGFANAIERRYGYSLDTKEQEVEFEKFVEETEELEFDYDMETFEDVLYCPNLKKIIWGKNRYLREDQVSDYDCSQLLGSMEKSILILDKANELLGMTIQYYGSTGWQFHYLDYELDYMEYQGYPQLPDMEIVDKDALRVFDNGSRISCTPSDPYAVLDNLLDNDTQTVWATTSNSVLRNYEMLIELKASTELRGVKVAQPEYNPWDNRTPTFLPSTISIQTSVDGAIWKNVTFFESNYLGRGSGEATLLPIAEGSRQVRYVKFTLRDGVDSGGNCMINLADIVLYK